MWKFVADKNFLESPRLEEFLRDDPDHRVVLIDFVAIEAYAGNPIKNMARSVGTLARYPDQVLILKSSIEMARLGRIEPHMRFDLVDWTQTRGFARFCRSLERALAGDSAYEAAILDHAKHAQNHLALMTAEVTRLHEGISRVGRLVGPQGLKARRETTPLPKAAGQQIIDLICELADSLFRDDPSVPKIQGRFVDARNYYIFRFAITSTVLFLLWAERGGAKDARPEKLRNDIVDVAYATAATYFDGLLSNDKKMNDVYEEACFLIEDLFGGRLAPANAERQP